MISFGLEFDNEIDARETYKLLWNTHGISGETTLEPIKEGKWRLSIHSEKEIDEEILNGLKGERVDVKPIVPTQATRG